MVRSVSWVPLFVTATLALAAACAEAGGSVSGAEITPEGKRTQAQPAMPYKPIEDPDAGLGDRWQDLYRDYFGPTGRPGSCLYRSECHNSASSAGNRGGGPNCQSKDVCWQSFHDKFLVTGNDDERADPDKAGFFGIVRVLKPDNTVATTTFMPKEPGDAAFSEIAGNRIRSWIKRGAPND